ncbi:MAG: hypothetical protein ABSC25_13645 [Roseiarcus sp.]
MITSPLFAASRRSRYPAPAPGPAGVIAVAPEAKTGAGIVEEPRQIGLSPHSARIILEIGDIARSAQRRSAALGSSSEYAAQTNPGVTIVLGGVLAP